LACDDHWLADDGYWPDAQGVALEHRSRALDVLRRPLEALEPERFCRTAERFKAEVDLLVWETTTRSGEIDAEDDASARWEDRPRPARRQRGHPTEGRAGHPPVGVGRALTRDGWPVRAWGVPGHTAEVPTIHHRQDDLRGWRVHRCVCVGERGMCSAAHRPRLSQALGRDMLAVPRRQVTEVHREVLSRPGRYRDVATNLRVKDVWVGEGARRRRSVVCHNPAEAAREQAQRARLVAWLRAALAALDGRQADPPKQACELMASRRVGRSLMREARGRLRLDTAKGVGEAKDAGTCVVTTTDDPLDAEEVALGYPRMMLMEGGFRRMKTTGLQTRPIDHGRPHRLIAPVTRCVLALRLERAADIRGQPTWRTLRQTLDQLQVVRYRMQGQTMVQRTQGTAPMAEILRRLGLPLPKRILDVSHEAHAPCLSSRHASKSPRVSS
jgi:hypothetical protein